MNIDNMTTKEKIIKLIGSVTGQCYLGEGREVYLANSIFDDITSDEITDTMRLEFVLKNGLPIKKEGKYRCFGISEYQWFDNQIDAIDFAIRHLNKREQI